MKWQFLNVIFFTSFIYGIFPVILLAEDDGIFGGRVSRMNLPASLLRLRVGFRNIKFLNKKDNLEFWSGHQKERRCSSYVIGKSTEYVLLKVPNLPLCVKKAQVTVGSYISIFSKDLINNIKVAKEVVEILVKKRLALQVRLDHEKKEMERYVEKVESVNDRFEVLKAKLELEWQEELSNLQEDKISVLKRFKNTEMQLGEIDHKLEQYKIYDQNLELDRWSLDSRLYNRK